MEITSLTNSKVKQWAKYKEKKYRDQDHLFLIEGEHLLEEAHTAGLIECVIVLQGCYHPYTAYDSYEVSKDILKKLADSVSGTWIMAICHMPTNNEAIGECVIALDGVQDPGNVGTILRSAYSFGYHTVLLSTQCADVYNEKVIRSTQGALFHMNVIRCDLVESIIEWKRKGYEVIATALLHATPLQDVVVQKPSILVMGNEGKGVSEAVLDLSDQRAYIEMENFESLNVAVAAAICMYTFRCQNR